MHLCTYQYIVKECKYHCCPNRIAHHQFQHSSPLLRVLEWSPCLPHNRAENSIPVRHLQRESLIKVVVYGNVDNDSNDHMIIQGCFYVFIKTFFTFSIPFLPSCYMFFSLKSFSYLCICVCYVCTCTCCVIE